MKTAEFLAKLKSAPVSVTLEDAMNTIAAAYDFTPCGFSIGEARYEAGQNVKSCQLYAFGQLHQLTADQALHCFGKFYTDEVLPHPEGTDHVPIRNFMKMGWASVKFDAMPLKARAVSAA